MNDGTKAAGVLLAAGLGTRFGSAVPKQFFLIQGKPVYLYSLERLLESRRIGAVIVVTVESSVARVSADIQTGFPDECGRISVISGGATRNESILNALDVLARQSWPYDHVLFHDGVRPFVEASLIDRVVEEATEHGAAIAGVKSYDPSVEVVENRVTKWQDQSVAFNSQMPECYPARALHSLHREYQGDQTLAQVTNLELMLQAGRPVRFVRHESFNSKLTVACEAALFSKLMKEDADEQ